MTDASSFFKKYGFCSKENDAPLTPCQILNKYEYFKEYIQAKKYFLRIIVMTFSLYVSNDS